MASQNNRTAPANRPSATAVDGIKVQFAVSTYTDRSRTKHKKFSPVFRVQIRAVTGEWVNRSFPCLRDGITQAWAQAVECVARARGLRRWAHLRRLQPDPAQFRDLRDDMRRRGHDIPESKLPGNAPTVRTSERDERRAARQASEFAHIKRTRPKLDVLGHLSRHGRTDPARLGEDYFQHVYARRDRDSDESVRRASARHALQRMERYGLVRLLADGDAKITAAGKRFLEDE